MKSRLFLLALLLSSNVQAACKLPLNEKIIVGCSYKCDFYTRSRLKAAGARLGYRVKVISLDNTKDIERNLTEVDSVLFPGGADIHPKYYLKEVTQELKEYTEKNIHLYKSSQEGKARDIYEYTLLKRILNNEIEYKSLPVLGICRGMQMIAVAKGMPLYLDIATELNIPNRNYDFDKIQVTESDSLMNNLYGEKKFSALEIHHQGIRVDYYEAHKYEFPSVNVSAFSHGRKIAESIEVKGMTTLGVQFHPEKSLPSTTFPVFKWFLTKACEYKTTHKVAL